VSTEHERIARIHELLARPSQHVLLGIGDDCAALAPSALPQIATVDAAIEGVHFSRAFMREDEIGYRALMAAASDVAAMGGTARAALCALALPAALDEAAFEGLLRGLAEAADALGFPIIGGNLARASEISLTTTILGECPGRTIARQGARPGDALYVTGSVGGAALGLAALRADSSRPPRFAPAVARFLRPRARLELAAELARCASAAIDVSDGLAQDLAHLCRASGVSARLELARVPRLPEFEPLARELGLDGEQLLLSGGEDYELLFSARPEDVPSGFATQIGAIETGAGVRVLGPDGGLRTGSAGFDHFR
jgi:thiamine-monophosphate kinase